MEWGDILRPRKKVLWRDLYQVTVGPKAAWPSSENCRPNWVQSKCLVKPAWLLSYFNFVFLFFCLLFVVFVVVVVAVAVAVVVAVVCVGVGVGGGGWWVVGVGVVLVMPYVCVIGFPQYVSDIPYPLRYFFVNPEETSRILITKNLRKKHPPTKNLEVHIYGGCGKKIPCGSVARSTTTRLTYLDLWNEIHSGKKNRQDVWNAFHLQQNLYQSS